MTPAVTTACLEDLRSDTGRIASEHLTARFSRVSRSTLCLMFTSGSTGVPKCVEATHAMALHEVRSYPTLARFCAPGLGPTDRVLQQTSVFWAASTWGQLDIALAFGAAILISSSSTPSARLLREAGITVIGAAPSTLSGLSAGDAPSVRTVFSWGEAMPA